ncbi:hypothetical protein MBLNU457_g2636t2 [Dothideomycetes sp. NU457]
MSQLAAHLEAYKEFKPVLQAFRLCRRFGKGTLTKLPAELMIMIEKEVLRKPFAAAYDRWETMNTCFEDRCDPMSHFAGTDYEDLIEQVMQDLYTSHPNVDFNCLEEDMDGSYYTSEEGAACECDGHKKYRKTLARIAKYEVADIPSHHDIRYGGWQDKVREDFLEGALSKILRNDFGLEAFYKHHEMDPEPGSTWHKAITICYLTLPSTPAKHAHEPQDISSTGLHSLHSAIVDVESLIDNTERHMKRFRQAMYVLGLDVFIHQSQLQPGQTIVGFSPYEFRNVYTFEGNRTRETRYGPQAAESRLKELQRMTWPQLLMLTKYGIDERTA